MIWRLNIIGYSLLLFLCHCVGPTSPFGVVGEQLAESDREVAQALPVKTYKIKFHPERHVYHGRSDFSLEIKSNESIKDQTHIQILHNGRDATESFIKNTNLHRSEDNKTWIYTQKNFRLKTLDSNDIQVRLKNGKKVLANNQLQQPECSLFKKEKLSHLGAFHAPSEYIDLIEKAALRADTNPLFLAGIVAQESGFNPKAVSWAKAIGLTQMTPLAEKQILQSVEKWPRYPGINRLSYVTLKSKIYMGEIDDGKEWRLNPEHSLAGGMAYVGYLQEYWNSEKNKKIVESLGGDFNRVFTEIVLASYNSGAFRVKKAIVTKQKNWKQHKSLKEAAKYIKKVSSYCYHYAEKENADDSET